LLQRRLLQRRLLRPNGPRGRHASHFRFASG
jgi:hypothetical protein